MTRVHVLCTLFSASALVFACTSFTGSDAPPGSGSGDGGSSDDGGGSSGDGGFAPSGTSFCSSPPGATVFCADFDEGTAFDAGWVSQATSRSGNIQLGPSFTGGSAPNALFLTTAVATGSAIVATPDFPLDAAASKHFVAQFSFVASPAEAGIVTLANLGFLPNESTQAALTSDGRISCADLTVPVSAGPHLLTIDLTVNASGIAESFRCALDNQASAGTAIAPGAFAFGMHFGPPNTPSATSVALDNIVLYVTDNR